MQRFMNSLFTEINRKYDISCCHRTLYYRIADTLCILHFINIVRWWLIQIIIMSAKRDLLLHPIYYPSNPIQTNSVDWSIINHKKCLKIKT